MPKKIKNKLIYFLAVVAILCSFALPLQAVIRLSEDYQPSPPQQMQLMGLRIGEIWRRLSGKKGTRGARNGNDREEKLCLLTPGKLSDLEFNADSQATLEIWHQQPMFLWQGEMTGIEVREHRSNQQLWEHKPLEPGTTNIIYEGQPLEPGKAYFWRNTVPLETLPTKITFRLMSEEKRTQIAEELEELASKLQAEGGTASDIALERIYYFAAQELWSDALREIYLMSDSPAEITTIIEQIQNHDFCLNSSTFSS